MMKGEKMFNGIFPDNKIKYLIPGGYIVNILNKHWIGIYNYDGKEVYLFDPLGGLLEYPELEKVLHKQFGKHFMKNNRMLEKIDGKNCGELVVKFLKHAKDGLKETIKWVNENSF